MCIAQKRWGRNELRLVLGFLRMGTIKEPNSDWKDCVCILFFPFPPSTPASPLFSLSSRGHWVPNLKMTHHSWRNWIFVSHSFLELPTTFRLLFLLIYQTSLEMDCQWLFLYTNQTSPQGTSQIPQAWFFPPLLVEDGGSLQFYLLPAAVSCAPSLVFLPHSPLWKWDATHNSICISFSFKSLFLSDIVFSWVGRVGGWESRDLEKCCFGVWGGTVWLFIYFGYLLHIKEGLFKSTLLS